jgi:hypothetical protein
VKTSLALEFQILYNLSLFQRVLLRQLSFEFFQSGIILDYLVNLCFGEHYTFEGTIVKHFVLVESTKPHFFVKKWVSRRLYPE